MLLICQKKAIMLTNARRRWKLNLSSRYCHVRVDLINKHIVPVPLEKAEKHNDQDSQHGWDCQVSDEMFEKTIWYQSLINTNSCLYTTKAYLCSGMPTRFSIQPCSGTSSTVRDMVARSISTSYRSLAQSSPIILKPNVASLKGYSMIHILSSLVPGIFIQ